MKGLGTEIRHSGRFAGNPEVGQKRGFWETKVGLLLHLWTLSNPQPNPEHEMSCTTSA